MSKTINENPNHTDVSLCYLLYENKKEIEFDENEFENYCWYGIENIPYEQSELNVKKFIEKFNNKISKNLVYPL